MERLQYIGSRCQILAMQAHQGWLTIAIPHMNMMNASHREGRNFLSAILLGGYSGQKRQTTRDGAHR